MKIAAPKEDQDRLFVKFGLPALTLREEEQRFGQRGQELFEGIVGFCGELDLIRMFYLIVKNYIDICESACTLFSYWCK